MARFTKCTTLADAWDGIGGLYVGLGIVAILGILTAGVAAALFIFSASFATPPSLIVAASALMAACLAAIATIMRGRDYFFDHRLICINDNVCAIVKVVITEENGDGDKSIDCLLAPADDTTPAFDYENTLWQSKDLIFKDELGLNNRGWHLDVKGNRAEHPFTFGNNELPFFHCEIEGTKIDSWTTALLAYLWTLFGIAAAALALAIAAALLGPLGWIILGAIALLILLLAIFGLSLGDDDEGAIEDIDGLGDATPGPDGPIITDSAGHHIQAGDILAIVGHHITDTGHNPTCWNEIHPLRGIAKIKDTTVYDNVGIDIKNDAVFDPYCSALKDFVNNKGTIRQTLTALEHEKIG